MQNCKKIFKMSKNLPLPERISAMISHLANKDRTRGCIIYSDVWKRDMVILNKCSDGDGYHVTDFDGGGDAFIPKENLFDKITGHPVMIGDVYAAIRNKWGKNRDMARIECQKVLYYWPADYFEKSLNNLAADMEILEKNISTTRKCGKNTLKVMYELIGFLVKIFPNYLNEK